MPRGPKRVRDTKIGLEKAVGSDIRRATRQRDATPHDSLHMALDSGTCGCLCPRCWVWIVRQTRGVCLCMECPCGGAPWYHEVLALTRSA